VTHWGVTIRVTESPLENSPIEVIFEDEWLLAVCKPAGLAVQEMHERLSIERGVLDGVHRELVLYHRLDKDTSGLVLLGKSSSRQTDVNRAMTEAFEKKRIRKAYLAVVEGQWKNEWNRVETFVARSEATGFMQNLTEATGGAKRALTTFRVLARSMPGTPLKTWIEAMPKTGRTHQIRLHCLFHGCPILGDRYYGHADEKPLALHAHRVDFSHPITGESVCLTALPPEHWLTDRLVDLDPSRVQAWMLNNAKR
jgi:23S rRNA pseudouridine955/2504/2580 synthase